MNTDTLRQHLHKYVDSLNDEKLEEFYILVMEIISDDSNSTLTDEDIATLDKRWEDYINGISKSYTWEEVKDMLRKKEEDRERFK